MTIQETIFFLGKNQTRPYYYTSWFVPLIMPREFKICGKFWSCHGKDRFQDNITIIPKIFATGKYISWQINTCSTGKLISWQTSTCLTNHATEKFFYRKQKLVSKIMSQENIYRDENICATNYVTGKYLSWQIKTYMSRINSYCGIVL